MFINKNVFIFSTLNENKKISNHKQGSLFWLIY